MKAKSIIIATVVSIILFIDSCNIGESGLTSDFSGAIGEVALVLDKEKWESEVGGKYMDILAQEQDALNQPEPLFDVLKVPPASFDQYFTSHRNIIINNIGPEFKEPKIVVGKDKWASSQIVITLSAPNDKVAIQLIENNREEILLRLTHAERERLAESNKKSIERNLYSILMNEHKLGLFIPRGYKLDVDSPDFVWISQNSRGVIQGIFVYYYPYYSLHVLTSDFLIAKRNEVLKKNVPGGPAGSYMTTEMLLPPVYTETFYKNRHYHELRGLWTLENGFMGGPFINLTTVDKKNNRVITVEGFLFAPNKEKRKYMRQLDAIIYSLQIREE